MHYKELIRRPKITTVQELQGLIFKLALVLSVIVTLLVIRL